MSTSRRVCPDIPAIVDIKEFLNDIHEAQDDELEAHFDQYSVDSDDYRLDHIDACGHLDDEGLESFESELKRIRRNLKVFDWLVHFLSHDTDVLDPVAERVHNELKEMSNGE